MLIFLHRHPMRLSEPTHLLTAQQILQLDRDNVPHRQFCHDFMESTFDFTDMQCRYEDMRYLEEILLVAFQMQNISNQLTVLRCLLRRRFWLKNWHRLRDLTYARILREEGEAKAKRRLVGLFGEVCNVAGPLGPYTAKFSWKDRISRSANC
uniref:Uncharacterized protein n=1 Tax=Pseudomonas phage HRDY3 TaxID=3236930 RepID=A0AB39CE60_9VIRU